MNDIKLSPEAEALLDMLFIKYPDSVRSVNEMKLYSQLSERVLKNALTQLVAAGKLVSLKEEFTITDNSLLKSVYDARPRATYYMRPERLEQLKESRLARLRQPYWKRAREVVLERHNDEVKAEFDRLWAEAQES